MSTSTADRGEQGLPVCAREIGAPDRAGEEDVAGEEAAVRVVREMGRRVAGNREHLERDARHLDRLAAREEHVGRVRAKRDPGRRVARVRRLEQHALALRHVHRRTRALREVGHAQQMVEVPMRDEDPRAARAEACERETQLGGVAARIHDGRLGRSRVGTDDVAIRADRSERQLFDAEHDGVRQLSRRPAAWSPRARRRMAWR